MIRRSGASDLRRHVLHAKLDAMLAFCETAGCRRAQLLRYFGQSVERCAGCDTCTAPPPTWDATGAVRELLMCVYRTGQRFGADHIANTLDHRPANEWHAIIRQCVSLDLLRVDYSAGGALQRTSLSAEVLGGSRPVALRTWPRARAQAGAAKRPKIIGDYGPDAEALFDALCAWRHAVAVGRGLPVQRVLFDSTIVEIAVARPESRWALRRIPGLSAVKRRDYGDALLEIVRGAEVATTPE
jgi:ATP-dependent DNA helicase RecQ